MSDACAAAADVIIHIHKGNTGYGIYFTQKVQSTCYKRTRR